MQKARRHCSEEQLRPLVSVWFQVLLTSLIGELFTVQSPYWSTIGHRGVFSLGGWAPHVQAEFHGLDPTLGLPHYAATGLSPSLIGLSRPFTTLCIQLWMTQSAGFPHSEIHGSKLVCQLPAAYRRLQRLSSPLDAKASTIRS